MLRILSVILVLIVTSCITEDPKGADQPLEYLNGEKYSAKSNVNIGPFPMTTSIKRKSKDTLVKGCVTIKGSSDFYQSPLKVEKLVLKRGEEVAKIQSTDEKGCFNFVGEFEDGDYSIQVQSVRFKGNKNFAVKGYTVENINFEALRVESH